MKKRNAALFAALLSLPAAGAFAESAPSVSPETGSANTRTGGATTKVEGATASGKVHGSLESGNSLPDTDNAQTGSANTQPGSLKAEGPTAQDPQAAERPITDTMDNNHGVDSAQDVTPSQ
ncbi:hypothetical protein [Salinicola endophyticus]|uniref:Uncharacterized protein n=1 Tax=Salinicola endophyticus TaxID=1949083 RepID=A0AB74UAL6_9GAMM